MERSHSGLVRRLGKAIYPQGYRGFESLPLRIVDIPTPVGMFAIR
jgi:hypothetical protein